MLLTLLLVCQALQADASPKDLPLPGEAFLVAPAFGVPDPGLVAD